MYAQVPTGLRKVILAAEKLLVGEGVSCALDLR
jgi:hypothetical protein